MRTSQQVFLDTFRITLDTAKNDIISNDVARIQASHSRKYSDIVNQLLTNLGMIAIPFFWGSSVFKLRSQWLQEEKDSPDSSLDQHMGMTIWHAPIESGSCFFTSVMILMFMLEMILVRIKVDRIPEHQAVIIARLTDLQDTVMPMVWNTRAEGEFVEIEFPLVCFELILARASLIHDLMQTLKKISIVLDREKSKLAQSLKVHTVDENIYCNYASAIDSRIKSYYIMVFFFFLQNHKKDSLLGKVSEYLNSKKKSLYFYVTDATIVKIFTNIIEGYGRLISSQVESFCRDLKKIKLPKRTHKTMNYTSFNQLIRPESKLLDVEVNLTKLSMFTDAKNLKVVEVFLDSCLESHRLHSEFTMQHYGMLFSTLVPTSSNSKIYPESTSLDYILVNFNKAVHEVNSSPSPV